jgi:hypothetical protein
MSSFRHPHPNGVLPGGNAFIAGPSAMITRYNGLGSLSKLTDEQLADWLTYLDGVTLGKLSRVSKVLYVFSQLETLWRDLVLLHTKGKHINFIRSWKITYAALIAPTKVPSIPSSPIKVKSFYSEYLFHQWLCCSYDVEKSIPGFFKPDEIPRVSAKDLTIEEFIEQFEKPNKPVIITDGVSHWPALKKWNKEYFKNVCGEKQFRATSASAALPATFTMKEYIQYAEQTFEESPLYLFERDFVANETLRGDYAVPDYFSSTTYDTQQLPTQKHLQTDLFSVLGEKTRPDYHWLVMGPAKSGSLFHIDPNQTNAWNVCIEGRKKWIFYPPNHSPPGVESSLDGGEVVVPITTGEWLLTFWSFHQEARYHANPAMRPFEVITHPGEIIFVPNGYWHMVVNLDFCIALTHNYVSTSNLSKVLHFLREKPDQISGVRDRVHEAIQPEELYEEFVRRLPTVLPQECVDKHVKESFTVNNDAAKKRKDTAWTLQQRKRMTKVASSMNTVFSSSYLHQKAQDLQQQKECRPQGRGQGEEAMTSSEEESIACSTTNTSQASNSISSIFATVHQSSNHNIFGNIEGADTSVNNNPTSTTAAATGSFAFSFAF